MCLQTALESVNGLGTLDGDGGSKVEPCHVEPCRPGTRSCNLFSAQLASNIDLSVLVLYGLISAAKRQCAQHCSGSVVAVTLIPYRRLLQ